MRLSAEQFAELVSVLDNLKSPAADQEKRRSARMELQAQVPISFISDDEPAKPCVVAVRDFSSRGIAILYDTPLAIGQQFIVELRRLKGRSISLLCTIVHSRPTPDGKHSIGAEFTCVLQNPSASRIDENPNELSRIRKSVIG
jgi:hypothetical protein